MASQAKTPKNRKSYLITYRRTSKRLAVDTTSLYYSCSITSTHHSCLSLLKSMHAISITCAEIHADHIVSSGLPHNNVLHFSSYTESDYCRVLDEDVCVCVCAHARACMGMCM